MADLQHQTRRLRGPLLDRAQAELEAGRPWRARAHLATLLQRDPANEDGRELLIATQLQMNDLIGAGRLIAPTERDDRDARRAVDAWIDSLDRRQAARWLQSSRPIAGTATELGPVAWKRRRRLVIKAGTDTTPIPSTLGRVAGVAAVFVSSIGLYALRGWF